MPWRKAIEQFYASYREARFQDVQTIFTRFFLQLTPRLACGYKRIDKQFTLQKCHKL